jgi:hypothetical protein
MLTMQAADRRQPGATSTPPSLPAPGWRRDCSKNGSVDRIPLAPPGAFAFSATPIRPRPTDLPAAAMVLAPFIGIALWGGILALIARLF